MKAHNHFSPSPSRPVILLGIALLLIMVLLSVILRQQDFVPRVGAPSLEASYHVLLTVDALNQNPPQSHWYLPTVSLAGEQDKHISWGATIASATGDYFYTSFYSPAFLAPYTWFKLTGQEPTIVNLARFNVLLGGLSVLFVYLLLVKLLTLNGYGPWCATTGALLACTVGIFGSEALLSHGVLYWSQSLYQPVLACSLYLFFSYLTSKGRRLRLYGALLIGVALIGPLIEWSGFVFNAGLVAILWWNRRSVPQWRPLAIAIIVVTVVATVTIVMHYSLVAGFQASLESFLARFEARSAVPPVNQIVLLLQPFIAINIRQQYVLIDDGVQ